MPSGWSGSGEFSSRYFAVGAENKNLAGLTGITVLVVSLSLVRALKKTGPALLWSKVHETIFLTKNG